MLLNRASFLHLPCSGLRALLPERGSHPLFYERSPEPRAQMARRAQTQPDRVQGRQFHLTFAALYPGELSHASIKLQILRRGLQNVNASCASGRVLARTTTSWQIRSAASTSTSSCTSRSASTSRTAARRSSSTSATAATAAGCTPRCRPSARR